MTVLVAGGTGRLGTVLVERLAGRGIDVRVMTRDASRAAHLASGVAVVRGDVRDPAAVRAAVAGASVVVSAVHGFVGPGRVSPASVDRDGNATLVAAAAACGADLVLLSVAGASADSPMDLFRMKRAAEEQARSSSVPVTVVRAGPFTELWVELLRKTAGRSGRPLVFGRGGNPISFASVIDVAALVDAVVDDPAARGSTFDIAGPTAVTMNELAAQIQAACDWTGSVRHIPRGVLRVGAATAGRLRPAVGRQLVAALTMDTIDMTIDATTARSRYPLPATPTDAVVAAACSDGTSPGRQSAHPPTKCPLDSWSGDA